MAEKSPETWLQSELSELLVNIHDALDAWSRLPFDCSWTRNPPASHYLMMLKGMEEQLLRGPYAAKSMGNSGSRSLGMERNTKTKGGRRSQKFL